MLVAANPRVDIATPYFEGWSDVARFRFDGETYSVLNPEFFDILVEAGMISAEGDAEFRSWILERLNAPEIDRNFVTFLTMRYTRDDEISARVRELSELDEQSVWRRWLDDTAEQRELLQPNGCVGWSFVTCVGKAFDRHRVESIPFLPNEPDWAPAP